MKIFDLHNDSLTNAETQIKTAIKIPNDIFVNFAIYKGNLTFLQAYKLAKKFNALKLKNVCLSFEDIGYSDLNEEALFKLNPFCVSLTYNDEGVFGYGVNEDKPLKKSGIEFIERLNQNNVAVDTSHLSKSGSFCVCERAKFLLNTHTAFMRNYKHKRNITDEQITAIIEREGIIGLTFVSYFLGDDKVSVETVSNAICDFCDKFGADNLSIGSDFFGTDSLPENLRCYADFYMLRELLVKRGYNSQTIEKIFFQNAYNFYIKVTDCKKHTAI